MCGVVRVHRRRPLFGPDALAPSRIRRAGPAAGASGSRAAMALTAHSPSCNSALHGFRRTASEWLRIDQGPLPPDRAVVNARSNDRIEAAVLPGT